MKPLCPNPACRRPLDETTRTSLCIHCGTTVLDGVPTLDLPSSATQSAATLDLPPNPSSQGTAATATADTLNLPGGDNTGDRTPRGPLPHGPTLPERIGRFEVRARLGEGAFGIVYRAFDPQLEREVALKVAKPAMLDTAERVNRFLREAKAAANLRHPNIVPVYDSGRDQNSYYLAAAYVDGGTLEAEQAHGKVDLRWAAETVRKLAEALGYAHRQGIIHRDVKPANVLLDGGGEPLVTDFGLAAREGDEALRTADGRILGTPAYMSPEQARGNAEPASDQYALGIILYELAAGRRPFEGPSELVIFNQLQTVPTRPRSLNRSIPLDLETVIQKCLEKEPTRRYATCEALADDLRRFVAGEPVTARRAGPIERTVRWARRSPFQAATAGIAAALVVALLVVFDSRRKQAESDANYLASENQLEKNKNEELRRIDDLKSRFDALYRKAQDAANTAATLPAGNERADREWTTVERDAKAGLELVDSEPAFANLALREPMQRLLEQAQGHLADKQVRAEARGQFEAGKAQHSDATFWSLDYSGLDAAENQARTRASVAAGLTAFRVPATRDGPPAIDRRFFTPEEVRVIIDRCYELYLLDAAATGRSLEGESPDQAQKRAREALTILDQADRLLAPSPPAQAGLRLRADFLAKLGDEAGAEKVRNAADATAPRLAADDFATAMGHYRREEFVRAIEPLAAVLRNQPDHFGAEYLLSVCRLREGQFQAAREGLTRCITLRPGFSWPYLLRGYAAIEQRRWDEARADFDTVLKSPSDRLATFAALVNRGVLAMRRRDWDDAERNLRDAVTTHPSGSAAYLNLALAIRQRLDAPTWQQELLLLGPGGPVTLAALGTRQRQDRDRALAVLDAGLVECPREARLHHERARLLLELDKPTEARTAFQAAIALSLNRGAASTVADDFIDLGRLQHRDGDHREAARSFQSALAIRPDRTIAWRLLAQPLLALRRFDEAGAALDRYLEATAATPGKPLTAGQAGSLAEALKIRGQLHEEEARAFRARGVLHTRDHNPRAALDAYTRGLGLVRDAELLNLRGWTYLTFNAFVLAQSDFDEALKLRPGYSDALLGRANVRVRLGEIPLAVEDATAGVKAGTSTARLHFNAARVHAQAAGWWFRTRGNLDAGREAVRQTSLQLARALELTPADDRSTFWREFVGMDQAFDAIRASRELLALESTYQLTRP